MTEEYSIGYQEGYQAGWNAAVDQAPAQPAAREPLTWLEILRKNPEATDEAVGAYLRGHAEYLTGEKFILETRLQPAAPQQQGDTP